MSKQIEPSEPTAQAVAGKVEEYLKDCQPGGVTVKVDPHGVFQGEFSWRVRVRPDREPAQLFQYYAVLADVEIELEDREQLNVWLVTTNPEPPESGETLPVAAERSAPPIAILNPPT